MTISWKSLIGVILASALVAQAAHTSNGTIKRLSARESRLRSTAQFAEGGSVDASKNLGKGRLTPNNKRSIIKLTETNVTDTKKSGEYAFKVHKVGDDYSIVSVEQNGKPFVYTKEAHKRLFETFGQELKDIITDNLNNQEG